MNDYVDIDEQEPTKNNLTVSVGEWILTIILFAIPIVNIVYFIYLLVSKKVNENKRNYALAKIVVIIISYILLYFAGGSLILYLLSHYGNALTGLNVF